MAKDKNTKPVGREAEQTGEAKRLKRTKLFLVIFAAVALVGITVSVVVGLFIDRDKTVDYMKLNLSKYVYVPESFYNGYKVTVDIPDVEDSDVEAEVLRVLCANKKPHTEEGEDANKPVYNEKGVTISLGDVANIYYRGYTMEDGVKKYFDGGCNYSSGVTELEIGSGTFIPGFESGLIDKNQNDYASLTEEKGGYVKPGDVITLTYTVMYADGKSAYNKTAMIDLSDPNLDERWGDGFSAYFNEEEKIVIGEKFLEQKKDALKVGTVKETEDGKGEDLYFDMKVGAAYRISEGDKLIVKADFPEDYSSEELKGKTAYFEVYIMTVKNYDAPELNDAFITDTLKLSAEDLSAYAGDDIVAKYKGYVKEQLNEARNEKIRNAVEDAFWEQAVEAAEIKKLPKDDVDAIYDKNLMELRTAFESEVGASGSSSEFDAYAREALGLKSNENWQAALRLNAETSVKQKLIFYYIVREEGFVPTEEEYNAVYEEAFADHLQDYLDYLESSLGKTNLNDEEMAKAKATVRETYGDAYWDELVRYEFAMDKIIDLADVTEK